MDGTDACARRAAATMRFDFSTNAGAGDMPEPDRGLSGLSILREPAQMARDFAVNKVHHIRTCVLPMPTG